MGQSLAGKRIWITGASRGLGRALAVDLARAGARLALTARDEAGLAEVAAAARNAGEVDVFVLPLDVTDPDACQRAAEQIGAALGGIDVLVANAGISMWTRFAEIRDVSVFERLIDVNYLGVVNCVRGALPWLTANPASMGSIVNISSLQARTGMPSHTGYAASKAATQIFLDALKMETPGLHVLGVYPGWISGTELRASALGADGATLGASRKSHNRFATSAEECSRRIVRALERKWSSLYIPGYLRLLFMLRPFAFPLVAWILTKAVGSQKHSASSQRAQS